MFNGKNFKEKGIVFFKDNFRNVIITTININNKKINIESSDFDKLKIIGANIRTLDKANRTIINNFIDEEKPDFLLLNECNKGKSKFKISNYKSEFSDEQEVGIIYKNIYFLDSPFKDSEDDYNLIKLANTKIGRLIIWATYLPP